MFQVYTWQENVITQLYIWFRKFIWSGDILVRKVSILTWKYVCKPINKGKFGTRSAKQLKKSPILLLSWKSVASMEYRATIYKTRYISNNKPRTHHIKSSIWLGISHHYKSVIENIRWVIGTSENINYWNDNWLEHLLSDLINILLHYRKMILIKVENLIDRSVWVIVQVLTSKFSTKIKCV